MLAARHIRIAIIVSIIWFPSASNAQSANPWEALADALSAFVEVLNDEALEVEVDRARKNLEPALKQDICGKSGGAIVFADMYKASGGSGRRLRGLIHIPGQCPEAAFRNYEETFNNSALNVLPQGYERDAENSFGIWVTCPSNEILSWQTYKWPIWVQMANAEDAPCPMDFASFGIHALHTDRVVRDSGVYFNVRYTVTLSGPGDAVASFSGWVTTQDRRNSVYTWFDSFVLPTEAEGWSEEEWKRLVERHTQVPFVSAPTAE